MKKDFAAFVAGVFVLAASSSAFAGAPFVNLEGTGGIAFNPVAYPADSEGEDTHAKVGDTNIIGEPRVGAWYVSLGDKNALGNGIDWTNFGLADTLFGRLEVSYGYQNLNIGESSVDSIHKNNVGAKFLVLKENSFDTNFVPAIAVGTQYKQTSFDPVSVLGVSTAKKHGEDYYVVATKLITQLPRPVLISGGVREEQGYGTGALGFDHDYKATGFANVDVVAHDKVIVGAEYKQGAQFSSFKNADYWNYHVAFLANKNLSFILAYVDSGDTKSANKVGFGNGLVLSTQYTF